ncbi:MAG: glycoside hydrolase family 125 protein [Phaeodactylibacter sp.]|nr:glycoside hydrolase family 125 protein [Phaeodactylibacter sp.]MCB9303536.1 glycoside hydrolase family 125 protein [Lewinellaceae bacterium]
MFRRQFLELAATSTAAGILLPKAFWLQIPKGYPSMRPPLEARKFTSKALEDQIREIKASIPDEELGWLFENCYPNTLDTTVDYGELDGKPDTFVITGDIDAMWLRDSCAQVWPYLPLTRQDDSLRQLIKGLIHRQARCVLLDPYANAFYKDGSRKSEWEGDRPQLLPGVHERKWEVDSLCYVIRLAHGYWKTTGDSSAFDGDWDAAMRLIVETFRTEQRKDGQSPYYFTRETTWMIDAPPFNGKGRPIRPVGLVASMFRPSDDATVFPFLIPSNLFAVQSLRQLAEIYIAVKKDPAFAASCRSFADEVEQAVRQYALVKHLNFGRIYAYEVDGYGNALFQDDANVPSLMSLAYLGVHQPNDPVYKRTRRFLLSAHNPYYLRGKAAEGQASPHSGLRRIWPMGIILRAMTSTVDEEILHCLQMLKSTHAGTGFMHEAFDMDNPEDFTRKWFAWANTLFGELIVKLYEERPGLLGKV